MLKHALLAGAALCCAAHASSTRAQTADGATTLDPITVEGRDSSGSLTAPSLERTRQELAKTPGAVSVIDADSYKRSTASLTIKEALDYTPGVFTQARWGANGDVRLSIRGSGLSRNYGLRSVQLYMDGMPINTADGYGDFAVIDPSAFRLVEVYKGANALRFGANALGGAINFVTPTGRDPDASVAQVGVDVGSFGHVRTQASSGGAYGQADYFITGSWQRFDGFRDHSSGHSEKLSGNVGYQLSEDVETRFYLDAASIRQNMPGEVSRDDALKHPKRANGIYVDDDYERNVDHVRLANKTTFRLADTTTVDVGAYVSDRRVKHPIFQYLDYDYLNWGGFVRATDEREISGHANRLVVGANLLNGDNDQTNYVNVGGRKGARASAVEQTQKNVSLYAENTFYVVPQVGVVTGLQYLYAERKQDGRFNAPTGSADFSLASPKLGLLWDIDPTWQAFANVSRSVEAPSYSESILAAADPAKAQKAWSYELGTRGRRDDFTWEAAVYRMDIRNELQCLFQDFGECRVVNADRTMHQGVELGFGAAILKELFVHEESGADKVWLNVAYTYSDFRFRHDTDFGNNELPGAPRHFVRAELLYKHPSGFYVGPNVEWVPEAYYIDSANTQDTKAYALLGAKVGYDAGGQFSAYVEARNLTGEKYVSSVSIIDRATPTSQLYQPVDSRAVYAGMKYRW
jgi:iron complex outermembrane receptor protein